MPKHAAYWRRLCTVIGGRRELSLVTEVRRWFWFARDIGTYTRPYTELERERERDRDRDRDRQRQKETERERERVLGIKYPDVPCVYRERAR